MSQAVRGVVAILLAIVILCAGFAAWIFLQKTAVDKEKESLQAELAGYQEKEADYQSKVKKFQKDQQDFDERIAKKSKENSELKESYDDLKSKYDEALEKAQAAIDERDDLKGRFEKIRSERDQLVEKIKNQPEKIVEKIVYKEREGAAADLGQSVDTSAPAVTAAQGDQYWAEVLKQKAALQLDLQKAKAELDQSALQVAELKRQNADIQLELKNLTDAKEEIARKVEGESSELLRKLKYNEELANSLSMEVARSRNEQKAAQERAERIKQDNIALQSQLKTLSTTKIALEKTIAQLNEQKLVMQKKLVETEGMIQGRIDEIWQIKQNLDQKIANLPSGKAGEVELPPIIVNANQQTAQPAAAKAPEAADKVSGAVISLNEQNNFVIVDLGEGDGSHVGRKLSVFRGNNQIATLEVIQVRKDISAADIKQKSTAIKVGDIVR
jgi:DNA repair exonuclease SbcCD ATPase subunit